MVVGGLAMSLCFVILDQSLVHRSHMVSVEPMTVQHNAIHPISARDLRYFDFFYFFFSRKFQSGFVF